MEGHPPATELGDLRDQWRQAAVERWYDSQDHVGQSDTDPEPYVAVAADAAVIAVLEYLRSAPERHTVGVVTLMERMLRELRSD